MATIAEQLEQLTQDRDDLVDNLTTKGITGLTGDETFTELVPEVLNIPSGGGTVEAEEKDVNFYDYDGTRVYSYTASEFANLSAFPANPTHDGLTAQGWNWSLSNAKTYVANNGFLEIGQLYTPTDGKTKIHVELPEDYKSPTVQLYLRSGAKIEIDWGDETSLTTYTSTSNDTYTFPHEYSNAGKYIISINVVSGTVKFPYASNKSEILIEQNTNTSYVSKYLHCIKEINLDNSIQYNMGHSFQNMINLEKITLGTSFTSYGYDFDFDFNLKCIVLTTNCSGLSFAFQNCRNLERAIFSETPAGYPSGFANCYNLKSTVVLDNIVTNQTALYPGTYNLKKIIVPSGITTNPGLLLNDMNGLETLIFKGDMTAIALGQITKNYNVKRVYLTNCTTVPTSPASTYSVKPDFKIIVPDALYNDWIVAENWSSYAQYIVKESEA